MSRLLQSTPLQDGFRMPAEFEPHAECWMLFPERPDVWRNDAIPGQKAFANVASAISQFEPVTVCASAKQYLTARKLLPENIRVVEMSSNDAWIRDCGPTFVVNDGGDVRGVDWEFNAWGGELGGLYDTWEQDNLVAQKVLEITRADRYKAPFVLEGGGIHVDGQGTLITTTSCLLNPNRNPGVSRSQMDSWLCDYLGVSKVIWLDFEAYEETDGHVDVVCSFVEPGRLVLNWSDNPDDIEYEVCRQIYEQLSQVTDAKGRPFRLHKLPIASAKPLTHEEAAGIAQVPGSHPRKAGDPVGGDYINFYTANGGIVVPTYDDPNDEMAVDILAELFHPRKIIGVPAREIAIGGGMVHCITQQQPRG